MGKRIVSVLLCALLLCLCAGCGSYKADASFTYLLEQNVTSLDPQTASNSAAELVISSLFEGLCRIDEDGEAIPGVARSWEANSDSTEFTFHLRRNAQWSDGTPLTAQDFVYGITRALSPATGSTPGDLLLIRGAKSFAAGEGDASTLGVVAEDEHTLIIRLEKSNPDFPALTAGAHYMPCSQAYFESCQGHYGLSSQYLLTNGPFTFGSAYAWQTDSGKRSITVSRSDTYRGERRVQAASVTFLIDYDEALRDRPCHRPDQRGGGHPHLDGNPGPAGPRGGLRRHRPGRRGDRPAAKPRLGQASGRHAALPVFQDPEPPGPSGPAGRRRGGPGHYAGLRAVGWGALLRPGDTGLHPPGHRGSPGNPLPAAAAGLGGDAQHHRAVHGRPRVRGGGEHLPGGVEQRPGQRLQLGAGLSQHLPSRIASGNYEAALFTLRAGGTSPYDVLKSFESTAVPALLESPEYDQALESLTFDLASYQTAEQLLQEQYVFTHLPGQDLLRHQPGHPGHHCGARPERQLHRREKR